MANILASELEISNLREIFHQFCDSIKVPPSIIDSNKFNVSVIPGGSSNINYCVEIQGYMNKNYFVKYQSIPPVSRYYIDNLEREFDVCQFLSQSNLAPKPIFFDKSRRFLVSKFTKGRNPGVNDTNFTTILTTIGKALIMLRQAPISLLKRLSTGTRICPDTFFHKVILPTTHNLATKILEEGSSTLFQFLEEITGIIHERLHYAPPSDCIIDWENYEKIPAKFPWGLLHNDLALRNIITNNSGIFHFVDWEFADFGDIAYDLAYLQSENLLLEPQIKSIITCGKLDPYIQERTIRYIRIFLPMLELANAYWTLNHISNVIQQPRDQLKLRPPHNIGQNLQYVRWKIHRLMRMANPSSVNENQLFQEIQNALKMFEAHLIIG